MTKTQALADAAQLFKALGHDGRLAVLDELRAGSLHVSDLVQRTGIAQPLVSQHLRVLRGVNLVCATREGQQVRYSLTDEHVGHIVEDAIYHAAEQHSHEPNRSIDHGEGGRE